MARLLRRLITKIVIAGRSEDENAAACRMPSPNMIKLRQLTDKLPESPEKDVVPELSTIRKMIPFERRTGPPDRRRKSILIT